MKDIKTFKISDQQSTILSFVLPILIFITILLISSYKGTIGWFVLLILYSLTLTYYVQNNMKSIATSWSRAWHEKNASLESIKEKTENLFSLSKRNIKIVSGKLNSDLYASSKIVDALSKALENNVKIEIILDGENIDPKSIQLKKWIEEDKILFCKLLHYKVSNHFTIVDDKHVRVEESHEEDNIPVTNREAYYWYSSIRLGQEAAKKFDEFKELCRKEKESDFS